MKWYVLTAKQGDTDRIRTLLEGRGYWVYVPTGEKAYFHRRKRVMIVEFYQPFGGYFFMVENGDTALWQDVKDCGASPIRVAGVPVAVDEDVVLEVLSAEENGLFDLHRGSQKLLHPFGIGAKVRFHMMGEEIRGFVDKLKGSNRVVVKAERNGRRLQAEVSAEQLAQV